MALLQTEFSKNDDPKVKSVINDQVRTDHSGVLGNKRD